MEADRLFPLHGRTWIWVVLKLFRLGTGYFLQKSLDRFPICCMLVKYLTLSSASSILQGNYPQSLQRRTETVARQLALWSGALQEAQELDIWEDLDAERRTIVIATLARLISKAVCPKNLPETEEQRDER